MRFSPIISKILLLFYGFSWILTYYFVNCAMQSLCYKETHQIDCKNALIVIQKAFFGIDEKPNHKCNSTFLLINKPKDCVVDVSLNLIKKCNGLTSCDVKAIYSDYVPYRTPDCFKAYNNIIQLNFYYDYQCHQEDVFTQITNIKDMNKIGGFITSASYKLIKNSQKVIYESTKVSIQKHVRFPLSLGISSDRSTRLLYLFKILENTYQGSCLPGDAFTNNYLSFNVSNGNSTSFELCNPVVSKPGIIFGPFYGQDIHLVYNINFQTAYTNREVFLIKYTVISCKPIEITGATVNYGHYLHNNLEEHVSYAIVKCVNNSFFESKSTPNKIVNELNLTCLKSSNQWNETITKLKCISAFTTTTSTIIIPSSTAILTSKQKHSSLSSSKLPPTIPPISSITSTPVSSTSTNQETTTIISPVYPNQFIRIGVPLLLSIIVVILIILLCCYFRYRSYCLNNFCECLNKLCGGFDYSHRKSQQVNLPFHPTHINSYHNSLRNYPFHVMMNNVDNNGMNGTADYNNSQLLSPFHSNAPSTMYPVYSPESYRMSTRTLSTRVDSKPHLPASNRNSMTMYSPYQQRLMLTEPTSRRPMSASINSNISYLDTGLGSTSFNYLEQEDQLPSKARKPSPFSKILRSASNLRNSLNRQSTGGLSDYHSGSQIALLRHSRPPPVPHPPNVMTTSDITPVYNHFKSPTIDTYLEPSESNLRNPQLPATSSPILHNNIAHHQQQPPVTDYVIYDQSKLTSTTTNQNRSMTESSSSDLLSPLPTTTEPQQDLPFISKDQIKRFSMISNNYYGLTPNPLIEGVSSSGSTSSQTDLSNQKKHLSSAVTDGSSPSRAGGPTSRLNKSNESIYSTIDDEFLMPTLDRRNLALPEPPRDK